MTNYLKKNMPGSVSNDAYSNRQSHIDPTISSSNEKPIAPEEAKKSLFQTVRNGIKYLIQVIKMMIFQVKSKQQDSQRKTTVDNNTSQRELSSEAVQQHQEDISKLFKQLDVALNEIDFYKPRFLKAFTPKEPALLMQEWSAENFIEDNFMKTMTFMQNVVSETTHILVDLPIETQIEALPVMNKAYTSIFHFHQALHDISNLDPEQVRKSQTLMFSSLSDAIQILRRLKHNHTHH